MLRVFRKSALAPFSKNMNELENEFNNKLTLGSEKDIKVGFLRSAIDLLNQRPHIILKHHEDSHVTVVLILGGPGGYEIHVIQKSTVRLAQVQETSRRAPASIEPFDNNSSSSSSSSSSETIFGSNRIIKYIKSEDIGVLMDLDEFYPTQIIEYGFESLTDKEGKSSPSVIRFKEKHPVYYLQGSSINYTRMPNPVLLLMEGLHTDASAVPDKSELQVFTPTGVSLQLYSLEELSEKQVDLFMEEVWRSAETALEIPSVNLFFWKNNLVGSVYIHKSEQRSFIGSARAAWRSCSLVKGRGYILEPFSRYNPIHELFMPPLREEGEDFLPFDIRIHRTEEELHESEILELRKIQRRLLILEYVTETKNSDTAADCSGSGGGVTVITDRTRPKRFRAAAPLIDPCGFLSTPSLDKIQFNGLKGWQGHLVLKPTATYNMNPFLLFNRFTRISYTKFAPASTIKKNPKAKKEQVSNSAATDQQLRDWIIGIPYTMWLSDREKESVKLFFNKNLRMKEQISSSSFTPKPLPPGSLIIAHISLFECDVGLDTGLVCNIRGQEAIRLGLHSDYMRLKPKEGKKWLLVFSLFDSFFDTLLAHGWFDTNEAISTNDILLNQQRQTTTTTTFITQDHSPTDPIEENIFHNTILNEQRKFIVSKDESFPPSFANHPITLFMNEMPVPYTKASFAKRFMTSYQTTNFSGLHVNDLWEVPLTVKCLFGELKEVELRDQCELPIPSIEKQQQQEEGRRLSFNLIKQNYQNREQTIETVKMYYSILWGMTAVTHLIEIVNPVTQLLLLIRLFLTTSSSSSTAPPPPPPNYRFMFICLAAMINQMNQVNLPAIITAVDIISERWGNDIAAEKETDRKLLQEARHRLLATENLIKWYGNMVIKHGEWDVLTALTEIRDGLFKQELQKHWFRGSLSQPMEIGLDLRDQFISDIQARVGGGGTQCSQQILNRAVWLLVKNRILCKTEPKKTKIEIKSIFNSINSCISDVNSLKDKVDIALQSLLDLK